MTICPVCKHKYSKILHPKHCPHCAIANAAATNVYTPPRESDDSGPGFVTGMIVGSLLSDSGGGSGIPYAASDLAPEPLVGGGGEFSGGGASGSWDSGSSDNSSSYDSSSSDSGSSSDGGSSSSAD